jgi:hypothetical protein
MTRVIKVQTNFAVGEINPELRGRIDLRQYESALERARNVICKPQGSIERRPGLKFCFAIPAAATPENGVRLVPFTFSTTQTYMLLFSGTRMYVFREGGTQVTNINGTGNDFLDVSSSVSGVTDGVTSTRIANLWYTQSADTLLLFEETMTPLKIVRGSDHNLWTVSDLAFGFVPKFAFTLTETSPASTLTPSAVDGSITLTASAATWHDGDSGTAQAGASTTITLKSGALATDDIYIGATVRITGGTGSGQSRVISDYVGSSKVATVASAWSITPDNTSTYTVSSVVEQFVENTNNFGRARIVSFTSSTVVEATVDIPFFNTDAISSGNWILETGYEDAWSSTRGWPRSATFHEGRLLVGGAQNLPTTIWGSRVGQFFDFDPGQSLDDEGLEATIDTDQVNAIVGVFSGRDFQVFTTGTEFVVPQLDGEPLTPLNFIFKPSTRRGSSAGTRPVSTEGGTLYLQRGGKAIREFLFSDIEGSYISNDISMLSSHLLQSPSRMAMRRGTNVDEGDLLHIVNAGDGSMAAFSILRSQNVIAPSLLSTDGDFLDVGVEDADTPAVYTVVKRTTPATHTQTITVSDAANIAAGATITWTTNAGVSTTLTSVTSGTPSSTQFLVGGSVNADTVADNIQAKINAVSGFTAANPGANVLTVSRDLQGDQNTTVTSLDNTRLTATNFAGAEYYVEIFDADHTTDSSIQYTALAANLPGSTTVTGLTHLKNATVKVIADDAVLADAVVSSSGEVTSARTATTYIEVGQEFPSFTDTLAGATKTTPLARTMPVETRLPNGPILGNKKRVVKVTAILDNTQSMTINSVDVPFRALGSGLLDAGVTKFTGTKQIGPFLGYDFKGQVEVTQNSPLFMTLLALDYRVSVSVGD